MNKLTVFLATAVALVTLGTGAAYAFGDFKAAPGERKPPRHDRYSPSTYKCSGDLGYLRRVYEEELDVVVDVAITPICENDDYGLMRSEGNAGALRQHIGDNDYMLEALDRANFGIDDVVGVRMTGDDSVILYVHTFHYR